MIHGGITDLRVCQIEPFETAHLLQMNQACVGDRRLPKLEFLHAGQSREMGQPSVRDRTDAQAQLLQLVQTFQV